MTPKAVISAYVRRLIREVITLDDVPIQAQKEVEEAYLVAIGETQG